MNFPEFLRSIWTDPRFQALDTPTRALLYGALSQVDIAGWWAPNPRLVAAELPGTDLKKAQQDLAPWVQVHPTGYWSFKGYVALQVGEGGLKLNNGFHKGLHRVLSLHQKREVSAGASPDTIEGLGASPTGGVQGSNPAGQAGNGGAPVGQARATGGAESPKSNAPSLQVSKSEVQPGGPGGDTATEPQASRFDDVLNLFQQLGDLGRDVDLDVKPWVRDGLHRIGAKRGWNRVYKAAGAYFTDRRGKGVYSLEQCLEELPRLLKATCSHESKTWLTSPVQLEYPKGWQMKHWRCDDCRHHEYHGEEFLHSEHVHAYTRQEGSGLVLDADGQLLSVPAWEACLGPFGCGHRRAVAAEVAA